MPFWANFQDFFKILKTINLKPIASQLLRLSQSPHKSYLLVKAHFWLFFYPKMRAILRVQKTPKMRIYEQVSLVWWLWYSQKLTCKKFEVSDFWNFEKIFKIRFKRQKRVIFTNFFLDQGIYSMNNFYPTSSQNHLS